MRLNKIENTINDKNHESNLFSTSTHFKKRPRVGQNLRIQKENTDSDDDDNNSSLLDKKQHKRDNRTEDSVDSHNISSYVTTVFESSREIVPQFYAGGATDTLEIDTSTDRDNRAILERNIKLNLGKSVGDDVTKFYQGRSAYKSLVEKKMDQVGANKITGFVMK
jgi:hypothetical protein